MWVPYDRQTVSISPQHRSTPTTSILSGNRNSIKTTIGIKHHLKNLRARVSATNKLLRDEKSDNNCSQLYAKTSFPDICSIPIQAHKARQIMGVSFQFNDTVIKIERELNTRRNTSFMGNGDKMEQNNDVTLISPPTMPQN